MSRENRERAVKSLPKRGASQITSTLPNQSNWQATSIGPSPFV
jgi:hypothetical protein